MRPSRWPPRASCSARLGLDPLGVIASGALIVAVAADEADALLARLAAAAMPAKVIGRALPREEGRWLLRGGVREPLPLFERDEIARIF